MATIPLTGPVVSKSIRTTDATPTECARFTPDLDSAGVYKVVVNGTATSGDRVATVRTWSAIRNDAGTTVTALSAEDRHESGSAGWAVDVAVDGTDGISVMVSVTGEAAHDVTWQATVVAVQCAQNVIPPFSCFSLDFNTGDNNDCVIVEPNYDCTTDSPISFSVWAKGTTTGALMYKYDGSVTNMVVLRTAGSGAACYVAFEVNGASRASVTKLTLADGQWHHYCGTYDGGLWPSGMHVYVDGVNVDGNRYSSITKGLPLDEPLNIGGYGGGAVYYRGRIDEVSVFGGELSPGEVAIIYNGGDPPDLTVVGMPAGLEMYLHMGDGDAYPTITDHSGNGYDGTMTNMEAADIVADAPGL